MVDGIATTDYFAGDFTKAQSVATGRSVGIYPEVKHSTFHAATFGNNTFENKLVSTLHTAYGKSSPAPVFIQSFESANLQYLNTQTDIELATPGPYRNDASGYGFSNPQQEMAYYLRLGVDGVFTDFPDTGVAAVASTPEPGSYALMLAGLMAVAGMARRRR